MQLSHKHTVVHLVVAILGVLVFVDFLLATIVSFSFQKGAYGREAPRLGHMVLCCVITIITVFYLIGSVIMPILQSTPIATKYPILRCFTSSNKKQSQSLVVPLIILVLNVLALITTLFLFLNVPFLRWISSDEAGARSSVTAVKCLEAVGLGLQVLFLSGLSVCLWWPRVMLVGCAIAVCSTFQVLITIVTVLINYAGIQEDTDLPAVKIKHNQIYVCLSLFLSCTGFLGYGITLVLRPHSRLSTTIKSLGWYYTAVCILSGALCLAWLVHSLVNIHHTYQTSNFPDGAVANPILACIGLLLDICCILFCARIRTTPKTKLHVKEYQLSALSEKELRCLASLIDTYNTHTSPDHPTGSHALELMKAYSLSPMPGFSCKVLRVYDEEAIKDRDNRSYESVRAWKGLDNMHIFEKKGSESATTLVDRSKLQEAPSKNALKRAQKKAKKKNSRLNIALKDESICSPEQTERDNAFRAELMATEALILLTTIDKYDLISSLRGKIGYGILERLVGEKSWLKPMCIRLGILGTHWPFRQMIFFTASTRKPTARTAAVLSAVSEWNKGLPSSERCALLYSPSYENAQNSAGLEMSNWIITKSLPTHVIDLRPFKGKSISEYLKSVKYRNQAAAFNNANGETIETSDFSMHNCTTAMKLWTNIAKKRTADGNTAVLKDPTVDFLHSLGSSEHNRNGWRRLLFLKVGGEVVGSCVLFFLGNTLTSDIQGLDHEKARVHKAYFVLMQEAIRIALRENISFVDFGPTTSKPKTDIGCAEIPVIGGIFCQPPLSSFVRLFANQVTG